MIWNFLIGFLCVGIAHAAQLDIRAVAANLTSDNKQTYSPDNGNHSNPEGAGARILKELASVVVIPQNPPADQHGEIATNAPRNRPYDWVLASGPLDKCAVSVKLAGAEFSHGLVFDSRVFEPLEKVAPVQKADSGVPMMQHMAVVRDFRIP